jgi:beta-glucosidase
MSDGPNGIRGTKFFDSVPAACLPCGTALGATWDKDLIETAGKLIARECRAKSVHVWLGPTVNIQRCVRDQPWNLWASAHPRYRSPLGGRGFESFSEDPVLGGLIAASMIKGVQTTGIGSAIKHFVANDMEHMRTSVNCIISQRALREIYLMPFQLAIRDANPLLLMTAYNRVNGVHMSEHSTILQDIVRREWRYDGCIVSDWYGTYSIVDAVEAGLDIEMPGPTEWRGKLLSTAMSVQKIKTTTIDERVTSVLTLIDRCMNSKIPERGPEVCLDDANDRSILRQLAADSIVLLKNEKQQLPFRVSKKVFSPPRSCNGSMTYANGL